MADIKATIAQARARLKVGEGENVDAGLINSLLAEADRMADDLIDNLKSANSESKNRKEKIRELQGELESKSEVITGLESKQNPNEELQNEVTGLREFKSKWFNNEKSKFESQFSEISKHPKFEKAMQKFKLPEKDGDKWDLSKLKDEEFEHNINALNELNELDYFAGEDKQPPFSPGKGGFFGEGKRSELAGKSTRERDRIWQKAN